MLRAAIAIEQEARTIQRHEDVLAAQETARTLEQLITSLAGMIEATHTRGSQWPNSDA